MNEHKNFKLFQLKIVSVEHNQILQPIATLFKIKLLPFSLARKLQFFSRNYDDDNRHHS